MADHQYARAPVGSPGAMSIATYESTPRRFDILVQKFTIKGVYEKSSSKALNSIFNPVTSLTGYEVEFTTPDLAMGMDEVLLGLTSVSIVPPAAGDLGADKLLYPTKNCLNPVRMLAFIPACNGANGTTSSRKIYIPYFLVSEISGSTYAVGEQPERTVSGTLLFDSVIGAYWQDIQINQSLTAASDQIPTDFGKWNQIKTAADGTWV